MVALKPRTSGHHLVSVGTLPLWWSFKFQQDEMLRGHGTAFNTDSLELCQLYFFVNGTCYDIVVGWTVKISHAVDSCPPTVWFEEEEEEEEEEYEFRSSTYGTQTFQSTSPCSSFASHREFHFEIADVRSQNAASLLSASSVVVSECRITLRLAVDVPNTDCQGGNMNMNGIDWPDKHDHTLYIVPLLQALGRNLPQSARFPDAACTSSKTCWRGGMDYWTIGISESNPVINWCVRCLSFKHQTRRRRVRSRATSSDTCIFYHWVYHWVARRAWALALPQLLKQID